MPASAVRAVKEAIGSKSDAIQRRYRRLLRENGIDPVLASFSLAALVQTGSNIDDWLKTAREAGRSLALREVPVRQLAEGLHLFHSALDSETSPAFGQLQAAAQTAATEGYLEVHALETSALADILEIETSATTAQALLARVLESTRRHFGAIDARLYQFGGNDGEPLAGTRVNGAALTKRLRDIRVFRSVASSGVLDRNWPATVRSIWSLPVASREGSVVIAQLGFADARVPTDRERRYVGALRDSCCLALERIARERGMRERSLKLIGVEEMERSRLSRELHDGPAQSLAVVRLHIEIIEGSLPEQSRAQLAEIRAVLEETILDVRRLISDLSPPVLEQLGVAAAIRQLVLRFRRSYKARVSLQLGKLPDIGQQYGLVLYRSLQECFSNISRHSEAKNINVSLTTTDRVLRLHVEDDGVGFHVKETMGHAKSFGLIGIRERVALLGGRLSVRSTPIGGDKKERKRVRGTRVDIELPMPEKNPS